MFRLTLHVLVGLVVVGCLSAGLATPPAIGVATANGSFQADNARVSGNTTLFQGSLVETGTATSTLRLDHGIHMQLGPHSRGRVYRRRLVLEKGEGLLASGTGYQLNALGLSVEAALPGSSAQVSLAEANRVQVAALAGAVRVSTAGGALLANLTPGNALSFQPLAAGAAAPFTVTGCVQQENGRIFLMDETTGVTLELKGSDLDRQVGRRVEITGTGVPGVQPGEGASGVIRVVQVKPLSGRCASVPGSGPPSGGAPSTGMTGTTKAIIAGVVIAGATAGSALALIGEEESRDPISR